jgi:nitrate/nitrite transporter NarK
MSVPYLLSATGGSKQLVGYYSLGSLSSAMVCMLLGGSLSDRWSGGDGAVRDGTVSRVCLLGLAVVSPVIGMAAKARNTAAVAVTGWVATCLAWSVSGQVAPLTTIACQTDGERGPLTGLVSAAWALGSLVGAQLHGRLVESRPLLLYCGLGPVLLAAYWAATVLTRRRQSPLPAAAREMNGVVS